MALAPFPSLDIILSYKRAKINSKCKLFLFAVIKYIQLRIINQAPRCPVALISFRVYVDELGLEFGINYLLAPVEAGVAREHVGYRYRN